MSLYKIQQKLKAPKTQFNSFGKYHYRNCEDILEAVKPLLSDGETLTLSDQVLIIGTVLFIEATATLKGGDETVSCKAQAGINIDRKGMDIAQSFGSSSSYARKYALNGLFCIDDSKDADTTNQHGQEEKALDVADIKKSVALCKTVETLNELWNTWAAVVNKAPNKADVLAIFAARKKAINEVPA